mmetsp:Transcript_12079/g.17616  ORF Transcript_12079/g.17616 Transcript_12079/m.17616 type:complete len:333 (-) Transcript_12079:275-1273(-)
MRKRILKVLEAASVAVVMTCMIRQAVVFVELEQQEMKNTKSATNKPLDVIMHDEEQGNNSTIKLLETDIIYGRDWWEKPTVIEEYKLIFFTIPKVGCTEWKRIFRKMMGMNPWIPEMGRKGDELIQNPRTNNLTTLSDYSLADAEMMMKDPEWTKAIFVREPKERLLSAFLDKFVQEDSYFREKCCNHHLSEDELKHCNDKVGMADIRYFLERTQNCQDYHWGLQSETLDEKWWPYINFVGYMHSLSEDARKLLKSLTSVNDGITAWERVGKTGWGKVGNDGFMQINLAFHATDANKKLLEYYNEEYEAFVQEKWAKDWELPYYHFDKIQLF